MQGRRFVIGVLVTLLIAGVAGIIGYNLGVGAGLATGADGTAPVVYAPWGFGGFGFFGFLLFILLIFLLVGAFRRAAWGGSHHGYGPGGWSEPRGRGLPPVADSMLQDWHRRAHGEEPPTSSSASPPGATTL